VRVLDSGCASQLLAAALLELPPDPAAGDEPHEWTPMAASQLAAFFDGLTGAEHHATLDGALAGILADFFPRAVRSSTTSPSSSTLPLTAAR
jgi:hypothetical protein